MINAVNVPIKQITIPARIPAYGTEHAAGADLSTPEGFTLSPGETRLVKCGFAIAIPEGCVGMVCSRSGLALKQSVFVLNAPGIIDADYRGEIGVILHNAARDTWVTFNPGDRIAQIVLVPYATANFVVTDKLPDTERGAGGFGSTGVAGK